jgi:tetratricopeptide (TPR) repeat protein
MTASERMVDAFRPGDVIRGVLRVEALLGEGGAASVYRVGDERTGRKLALKQLQPPDDERRALVTSHFEREFYTLSQLAHPRIIEVYDYGVERGSPYYTMELLDGEDLRERGKLPWREACALLRDVASSLAIIHSRGLVHRDVSARNVRCTSDGRAKLIDFGAMAPTGVSHRLVGTAPFVPPEALQLQALDGRADLYSLGALAYWTLAGRYAYPAQAFEQLRNLWRSPPRSPRDYEPELPQALADLVMQLLQLDRDERPSSAAAVMERLCGIAGLELQELPQVGRAYLVMPTLVGRDAVLREARGALLRSMQSARGESLLIEGLPGSGRSRFLDACVLEAKLMGAVVLRGDAAEGSAEPYALARALCSQLLHNAPEIAQQNAQPRLALLACLLPELDDRRPRSTPRDAPQRRHLQAALRDWLLAIARTQHIVIAVDDVTGIDEPSAAWLGALAHGAQRRRLTLLLTASAQAAPTAAFALLSEVSRSLRMDALTADQTEALLRSLFGDTERLVNLAARVQQLAGGIPRRIMDLLDHLIARGSLRYEAGSWALPIGFSAADLPATDGEALQERLKALPGDALSLLQTLSLTDPRALSLPDYALLTEHGDAARTFRAIDELVAAGLLVAEGEHYRVVDREATAWTQNLGDEQRRAMHGRLARVLQGGAAPSSLLLLHMLCGGQEDEAIKRILASPVDEVDPRLCEVLEWAVRAADRLELPMCVRLRVKERTVYAAAIIGRSDTFTGHAWPLMERLERDSGLLDYAELSSLQGPASRLEAAFARAQQRYDALPEQLRPLTPQESAFSLMGIYGTCGTMSAITLRLDLLERVRSLEPWYSISPRVELVDAAIQLRRASLTGQHHEAHERCKALLAKMEQLGPEKHGFGASSYMRLAHVHQIGLMSAIDGRPSCAAWVSELEHQPGYRGNAWRVRTVYELVMGNLELAREHKRRAELLDLQDSGGLALPGTTTRYELMVYSAGDDVIGVKRSIERIEALAAQYAGWPPMLSVARSHYRRLQGDPRGALEALQPAIAATAPGRHLGWILVCEARLMLLRDAGHSAEAADLGLDMLRTSEQHALQAEATPIRRLTAEALAQCGRADQALQLIEACLEHHRGHETHGIQLSLAYETRARVAIAMRDEAALRQYAARCVEALACPSPGLSARYERLMREAASAGVILPPAQQSSPETQEMQDAARTVYSRMLTCVTPAERAERGLQLLLEATGAQTGHLFGLRAGRLRWLASGDQSEPSVPLTRALAAYLDGQLENETALAAPASTPPAPLETVIDDWGRELEPLLLRGKHAGEAMIAGVAALHFGEDERPLVRTAMLAAVLDALIAGDIVDPITCVA